MKKLSILGLLAALTVMIAGSVYAAAPKTKADHETLAAKYEKLAGEQTTLVQEHTQMKKDYRANQATYAKATREKVLTEMDQHCDAIIAEAKKLADEYKAMATWHKMRAEELP